jgi:hypothetical protein
VSNLVHEGDQECKWVKVFVDGNPVATIFCGRTVIAEFGEPRVFDPELDFVLLHQIRGV